MRQEGEAVNSLQAVIAKMPRIELIAGPTPIERLHRIEEALGNSLGGVRLFVKRDDVMGLGGGGSKLRKLEFLLGDAKTKEADTVIAVGGRQSNHARLTAAAAARCGLKCELMLTQAVPRYDTDYQQSGNVLLDNLFGATIHDLPSSANAWDHANARAISLRAEGRGAYVTPTGGSSPIGCLGYAACALEIVEQSRALGIQFDRIVIPNGSSGTHAGLAAGFVALEQAPSLVRSFCVLANEEDSRDTTAKLLGATLQLLDVRASVDATEIDVIGSERGSAYGAPTASMMRSLRLMARCEGLLLDPVYSGKAFAGLLAGICNGDYAPGHNVLFIMTGGSPGLFAYRNEFAG